MSPLTLYPATEYALEAVVTTHSTSFLSTTCPALFLPHHGLVSGRCFRIQQATSVPPTEMIFKQRLRIQSLGLANAPAAASITSAASPIFALMKSRSATTRFGS